MPSEAKLLQGTPVWFGMVGELMVGFDAAAGLLDELSVSLVERYTDGSDLWNGLVQGIRFDVVGGRPSFHVGVGRDERGDVTIEVTTAIARELNLLQQDDPAYAATLERASLTGAMRVVGDPSRFGDWVGAVHDPIVARTY